MDEQRPGLDALLGLIKKRRNKQQATDKQTLIDAVKADQDLSVARRAHLARLLGAADDATFSTADKLEAYILGSPKGPLERAEVIELAKLAKAAAFLDAKQSLERDELKARLEAMRSEATWPFSDRGSSSASSVCSCSAPEWGGSTRRCGKSTAKAAMR